MPTLTINGRDVQVGDEFLHLSPEQQNATVDEIAHSMGAGPAQTGAQPTSGSPEAAPNLLSGGIRSAAEGVPVLGGLADRASAGINATLAPVLNGLFSPDQQLQGDWSHRYQQSLAQQQGMDQAFRAAHPNVDTAAKIAGGAAATAPLAAVAMPARVAQMAGGLGLAARAGVAASEGAGLGAADAGTRSESVAQGAGLGALAGAGGSVAGDALGGLVRGVRSLASGSAARADARAADIVRQLGQSDALTPGTAQAALDRLGPDGVLADLGPNMQQGARAVASAPGSAQQRIVTALTGRAQGAGQRITDAMDTALGPRSDVLASADQIAADRAQAAAPLYDRAYRAAVPMTDDVRTILARPQVDAAVKKAGTLAANAGEVFDFENPTAREFDYVKRALDDQIQSNLRAGNNNEARILIGNRNALVDHVDQAVPDYAAARKVFSDYSGVADALANGQKAFSNASTPDMLARQTLGMNEAERDAFRQGARQQIENTMGTARNDANAARAMMDKGFNREKMEMLLGPTAAGRLNNAVDAERDYAATLNAARGGSMTDRNILARQIIPGEQTTPVLRSLLNMRFGDAALGAGEKLAGGFINARNERTRDAVARALLSRDASILAPAQPARTIAAPTIAGLLVGSTLPAERQ